MILANFPIFRKFRQILPMCEVPKFLGMRFLCYFGKFGQNCHRADSLGFQVPRLKLGYIFKKDSNKHFLTSISKDFDGPVKVFFAKMSVFYPKQAEIGVKWFFCIRITAPKMFHSTFYILYFNPKKSLLHP